MMVGYGTGTINLTIMMITAYTSRMALLLAVIMFAGCTKAEEPAPGVRAGLAVVNAVQEAQAVLHRLDVGRGLQQLGQGLRYRAVDYYAVPSYENCRLEIISSNELAPLIDT